METNIEMMEGIDLTPAPRVLRMLGEIDFKAWQCLAEIIDNSIDSFYGMEEEEKLIEISLPFNFDAEGAVLKIKDNGKGMNLTTLGSSVRAGFSGNNPIDKMGLFGMGFNISTARLGGKTEIITTTKDSDSFYKLVIDFNSLEIDGHFIAPLEVIKKKTEDIGVHGTEIIISKLRKDHVLPLKRQRKKTIQKLGKIYGRHLRCNGITIKYDNAICKPFTHCVWDEKRMGEAAGEPVPARIEIDRILDSKKYCSTCWVWLESVEHECPSCQSATNVSERERKITGWVGIQRYLDKTHYGIDLIRNGRVIEELDKTFFYWNNPHEDDPELEYPLDGQDPKGRIVGELEIDFVQVSHQKDAFIKNTQDWKAVMSVVRGDGPMRPNIAKRFEYARNTSPLSMLFNAFRQAKASVKNLIPKKPNGSAMIKDEIIDDYKARFNEGIEGYISDDKWWELVVADSGASSVVRDPTGGNPFADPENNIEPKDEVIDEPVVKPVTDEPIPYTPKKADLRTKQDVFLSKIYSLDYFERISVKVIAQRMVSGSIENGFSVELRGAEMHFTYNPEHSIFKQTLLTPADFLINELAYQLHRVSHNKISNYPLSLIELNLRNKYFPELLPTLDEVERQTRGFIEGATEHFRKNIDQIVPIDLCWIEPSTLQKIKVQIQKARPLESGRVDELLSRGEFLTYSPIDIQLELLARHPEVLFDGNFFAYNLADLDSELAESLARDFGAFIQNVLWFQENSSPADDSVWKGSVKRLIAWFEIINGWRV